MSTRKPDDPTPSREVDSYLEDTHPSVPPPQGLAPRLPEVPRRAVPLPAMPSLRAPEPAARKVPAMQPRASEPAPGELGGTMRGGLTLAQILAAEAAATAAAAAAAAAGEAPGGDVTASAMGAPATADPALGAFTATPPAPPAEEPLVGVWPPVLVRPSAAPAQQPSLPARPSAPPPARPSSPPLAQTVPQAPLDPPGWPPVLTRPSSPPASVPPPVPAIPPARLPSFPPPPLLPSSRPASNPPPAAPSQPPPPVPRASDVPPRIPSVPPAPASALASVPGPASVAPHARAPSLWPPAPPPSIPPEPRVVAPPQRTDILTARAVLDDALLGLRNIRDKSTPVREVDGHVRDALGHTYRALAHSADFERFQQGVQAALACIRKALMLLQLNPTEDPTVDAESARIARAVRALNSVTFVVLERAPEVPGGVHGKPVPRALRHEPALVDLDRDVLEPALPLPELPDPTPPSPPDPPEPAPIATLEELLAFAAENEAALSAMDAPEAAPAPRPREDAPRVVRAATPPETEREYFGLARDAASLTFERARLLTEELGALGLMRRPVDAPGVTWPGSGETERRLLARVDALFACGTGVFPGLVRLLEDRPLPDPDLTWALLFLFGSIAGDDALDQLVRLVQVCPLDDDAMSERVADALARVAHPGVEPAMRAWLADPSPVRRALALTVLARRRAVMADEAVAATSDPDERVVLAAARALGVAHGDVHAVVLETLLDHPTERVVRAAFESALARRAEVALRRAVFLCERGYEAYASAARYAALAGRADSYPAFPQRAPAQATLALVDALGWYGHAGAVPFLLDVVEHADGVVRTGAVLALQRITGAGLPEDGLARDYEPDELPFKREWLAPEFVPKLSEDHEEWRAWWAQHGAPAQPGTRYRHGHAWTPRDNLWELLAPESSPRNRALAHLELVVRTGGTIPFDPDDFVARQRRQLEEWQSFVQARAARSAAGTWPVRFAK